MENKKEHTFVIMAHKESPYLEECIISLKKQTVQSEILMTTPTPSLFLERLSEKYGVPIIVNPVSKGIAFDWSFAYDVCRTKYVTLAHQDDLYFPEYAELCLRAVRDQEGDIITFTDYCELIGDRLVGISPHLLIKRMILTPFLLKRSIGLSFIKRTILSFGNSISCPTVMYNKERIGFFEFSESFQCNLDWDAWFRLSKKQGDFVYVNKKLLSHRRHEKSVAYKEFKNGVREGEDREMLEKFWPKKVAGILARIYRLNLLLNP